MNYIKHSLNFSLVSGMSLTPGPARAHAMSATTTETVNCLRLHIVLLFRTVRSNTTLYMNRFTSQRFALYLLYIFYRLRVHFNDTSSNSSWWHHCLQSKSTKILYKLISFLKNYFLKDYF